MRFWAILLAWALAAQVTAPALALASTVRGCCCAGDHGQRNCHCPACSKARSIEEGQASVRSCNAGGAVATVTGAFAAAPPSVEPVSTLLVSSVVFAMADLAPPGRAIDVPTPPPLG